MILVTQQWTCSLAHLFAGILFQQNNSAHKTFGMLTQEIQYGNLHLDVGYSATGKRLADSCILILFTLVINVWLWIIINPD